MTTEMSSLERRHAAPDNAERAHSRWIQALLVLPPLLAAMAAMPLLLFWIMGASAFAGTPDSGIFSLGLYALLVYPAAYIILGAMQLLSAWLRWPLIGLFHSLIWMCFLAFIATVGYALVILNPFQP